MANSWKEIDTNETLKGLKFGGCGLGIWMVEAIGGFSRVRYHRVGMDTQFLRVMILAGPAYFLVQHEAHQLFRLLPTDVHHEYIPSHGVFHLSGHGL